MSGRVVIPSVGVSQAEAKVEELLALLSRLGSRRARALRQLDRLAEDMAPVMRELRDRGIGGTELAQRSSYSRMQVDRIAPPPRKDEEAS